MQHVDIDEQALADMGEADPDEPIVMLNLLKFREVALDGFGVDGMSGEAAFRHYGVLNAAEGVQYGAEPIWLGTAHRTVTGGEDWDLGILVRYPSRQHFIDKVADPAYREIAQIRAAAVADSRLIELSQRIPAP